jgi:S-layer protein (TIGR01564 family)
MRLRKAIKKIVALGTGTTMIGATLLGASAANLNEYPSPFVKDGVFNGKIVVGAQAAAQDVIGSIEIATTLQSQSVTSRKVRTGGTSATTSLIGDSFKIEKSSDKLNMFELLNDPVNVASSDDLDALKGGSITNEKGTYKYDQRIDLENITYARASVIYEIDTDQDDDPAVYLKFQSGYHVYSYMMTFPTALKSDIDASDDWEDLDNKKISFL